MRILLVVILVGVSLAVLGNTVSRARDAYRQTSPRTRSQVGGSRSRSRAEVSQSQHAGRAADGTARGGSGFLDHRRQIRLMRERFRLEGIRDDARNRAKLAIEWARHRMRMEQREAEWDRKNPPATAVPNPPEPPPTTPANPPGAANPPGSPNPRPATVPGQVVPEAAPAATPGPPPGTPGPVQTEPKSQPGGNPMSSGAVEQAVDGTQGIHARAASGGIRAKQWAVKACAEVFTRLSAMMLMLSRTLSDARYGPEITEPLAQAAQFASAAAMACGQADTAITSLANMTVGELADSPRQAPHHDELSENGAR